MDTPSPSNHLNLYENAVTAARDLLTRGQSDQYRVNFPYSTFTIPRPGDTKNEPGRQSALHCLNEHNVGVVEAFTSKYALQYAAEPEKFLPKLKEALISEFGQDNFDKAEANHRQKFRLVEGIGSFINSTLTWGKELTSFLKNPTDEVKNAILESCRNIESIVTGPYNGAAPTVFAKIATPVVQNVKSQDVATQCATAGERVMSMVNASAGCEGCLEDGGGTFGDPFYSLTTQEEDLYRSFPFHTKFFAQFVLSRYIEATTPKEVISKFVYLDKFAPKNGKCLVLQNGNQLYFFSAANDNTKVAFSDEQQTELFTKVFATACEVAIQHKVTTFVAGAFGLGVFKGNAHCLGEAVSRVLAKYVDQHTNQDLRIVFAYFIRNPNDATAIANFNILADKFESPHYS